MTGILFACAKRWVTDVPEEACASDPGTIEWRMSDTYRRGDWTIRVSRAKGFLRRRYEGFFREALRRDSKGARKHCLQFTLFKGKESDEAIVQVQIFKDGSVQSWVYEPCMVRVFYWKKLIVLGVFEPREPWE